MLKLGICFSYKLFCYKHCLYIYDSLELLEEEGR